MDKESIFELQKIDCNCNDCKFMIRDFETYNKWAKWHEDRAFEDFERAKKKALLEATAIENIKDREGMLRVANKMKFQFDKTDLLNYGNCDKLNKPVSFIPGVCQLETQQCFVHRKENR